MQIMEKIPISNFPLPISAYPTHAFQDTSAYLTYLWLPGIIISAISQNKVKNRVNLCEISLPRTELTLGVSTLNYDIILSRK